MNIGRKQIIDMALDHASKGKNIQQRFDSFLSGVNFILKELDGTTIVCSGGGGKFVNKGTVTNSFSWSMRNVEYSDSKYLPYYLRLEALGSLEVKFDSQEEAVNYRHSLISKFKDIDLSTSMSKDKLTVTAILNKELVSG